MIRDLFRGEANDHRVRHPWHPAKSLSKSRMNRGVMAFQGGSFEEDDGDWLEGPPVFEFREGTMSLVEETAEAVARLPD